MMRKSASSAKGDTLSEQDLFVLEQHHLPSIKKLLESGNLHDLTEETISGVATEINQLIIDTRKKPLGVPQALNTSKDSLSKNLHSASIKLHLAWDQLESKGKKTRYYQHLLACKGYLENAYEQYVRIIMEEKNKRKDSNFTVTKQITSFSVSTLTFLTRMQTYFRQLSDSEEWLQKTFELISTEDELWADQCSHAIFYLREMSQCIQGVCTLLDSDVELPPGISQQSCELMVKLYHVDEQVRTAASLIASFRPVCQAKTKQAANMKVEILQKLEVLKQNYNSNLQNMSLFLRKVKSSESLHTRYHGLSLIQT